MGRPKAQLFKRSWKAWEYRWALDTQSQTLKNKQKIVLEILAQRLKARLTTKNIRCNQKT